MKNDVWLSIGQPHSFIAQLVEHCTGICGGHGVESRRSPEFFQASFKLLELENLLQCDYDHSSLSSTTTVQI